MIRIGLPAPTMMRLRLKAQLAARGLVRRFGLTSSEPVDASISIPVRDSVSEPDFSDFHEKYNILVDLLCYTAREGLKADSEQEYANLRSWFLTHYEQFRPILKPYLVVSTNEGDTFVDPFESLYFPASVESVIHHDSTIHRVMESRIAIEACAASR